MRPALSVRRFSLPAVALFACAIAAAVTTAPAQAGDRRGDPGFQGRSAAVSHNGMAATAQPLATQAAVDILKAGGSAVDAAVAANAVLGLTEPVANGIGGDLFALVYDPTTRQVVGLDASGFASLKLDVAALRARSAKGAISDFGMDSVTVPGAVAGWEALHRRYGKLPLAQVLAPAVKLAREGFAVTPVIAQGWARNLAGLERAGARIEGREWIGRLYAPGGAAPVAGERFTNPDLGATLEAIGAGGADAFYRGAFGADLEAYFRAAGRQLSAADLAAMKAEWVTPISTDYRGTRVYQIPPATQGLAVLQMLELIERFPIAKLSEADRLHVIVEAKKLAFADRARFLGDPRRSKVPVAGLLDQRYLAARSALISMDRAMPADVPAGDPEGQSDTTYLATADSAGMMVSLIQSNYAGMGSGVIVPRRAPVADGRGSWGFMLQNRGSQFTLRPGEANTIAPGKRPFHTIIPGMATRDGAAWLSFGLMGGTMQPQGHVQVLVNLIDLGMNVQAAGDAPRVRHVGGPDPASSGETEDGIWLESQIGAETRASLEARGHRIMTKPEDVGGYQAVMWDPKTRSWWGGTEMRKDGLALGY